MRRFILICALTGGLALGGGAASAFKLSPADQQTLDYFKAKAEQGQLTPEEKLAVARIASELLDTLEAQAKLNRIRVEQMIATVRAEGRCFPPEAFDALSADLQTKMPDLRCAN